MVPILLCVLVIINWLVYHKLFRVVYFDLGRGLIKELVGCFLVAVLELVIILFAGEWLKGLLGGILSMIINLIGWILRIITIIICITLAILAISWLLKFIQKHRLDKGKKGDFSETIIKDNKDNQEVMGKIAGAEHEKEDVSENIPLQKVIGEETCGNEKRSVEEVCNYIVQNFGEDDKIKAIQYYRKATGVGLKEAKKQVDTIFESKKNKKLYCTGCGNIIIEGAKFCSHCGKGL